MLSGKYELVTDKMVLFWKPPSVFGQWTRSEFEVDGVKYVTAEQFMMAEKARLFGDEDVRNQILDTTDPKLQKALGRQVRNFDESRWREVRVDIVVKGNVAKFSQNPKMKLELLATGDRCLVEASPLDRTWGIGLAATNPKAQNPNEWRGLNLLGIALMKARDILRDKEKDAEEADNAVDTASASRKGGMTTVSKLKSQELKE